MGAAAAQGSVACFKAGSALRLVHGSSAGPAVARKLSSRGEGGGVVPGLGEGSQTKGSPGLPTLICEAEISHALSLGATTAWMGKLGRSWGQFLSWLVPPEGQVPAMAAGYWRQEGLAQRGGAASGWCHLAGLSPGSRPTL